MVARQLWQVLNRSVGLIRKATLNLTLFQKGVPNEFFRSRLIRFVRFVRFVSMREPGTPCK